MNHKEQKYSEMYKENKIQNQGMAPMINTELPINRKVYKRNSTNNNRISPSDPKGSLDDFFFWRIFKLWKIL